MDTFLLAIPAAARGRGWRSDCVALRGSEMARKRRGSRPPRPSRNNFARRADHAVEESPWELARQSERHKLKLPYCETLSGNSKPASLDWARSLRLAEKHCRTTGYLLDKANETLTAAFAAVSRDALAKSNEAFLQMAQEKFKALSAEAAGTLDERKAQIGTLLKPVEEMLGNYQKRLAELETQRTGAMPNSANRSTPMSQVQSTLTQHTTQARLRSHASQRPRSVGRNHAPQARRTRRHVGPLRFLRTDLPSPTPATAPPPDMVVHLPADRRVVIDCKAVLGAFLDAAAASDDAVRLEHLKRHANLIRARRISPAKPTGRNSPTRRNSSCSSSRRSVPLRRLRGHDATLLEDCIANRVIIATPTTLIARHSSRSSTASAQPVSENAESIRKLGTEIYDRLIPSPETWSALANRSIPPSITTTRPSARSKRVLVSARKISELGAGSDKDLPEPAKVDRRSREARQHPPSRQITPPPGVIPPNAPSHEQLARQLLAEATRLLALGQLARAEPLFRPVLCTAAAGSDLPSQGLGAHCARHCPRPRSRGPSPAGGSPSNPRSPKPTPRSPSPSRPSTAAARPTPPSESPRSQARQARLSLQLRRACSSRSTSWTPIASFQQHRSRPGQCRSALQPRQRAYDVSRTEDAIASYRRALELPPQLWRRGCLASLPSSTTRRGFDEALHEYRRAPRHFAPFTSSLGGIADPAVSAAPKKPLPPSGNTCSFTPAIPFPQQHLYSMECIPANPPNPCAAYALWGKTHGGSARSPHCTPMIAPPIAAFASVTAPPTHRTPSATSSRTPPRPPRPRTGRGVLLLRRSNTRRHDPPPPGPRPPVAPNRRPRPCRLPAHACVHEDQIDILFDLAGHTSGNPPPLAFARKPALSR